MLSEHFRKQNRENLLAEIISKWPINMQEKLFTGDGDERIYPIWQKTLMSGEFDHLLQFTNPEKAAVDVGALLGQYSLTLSAVSTTCLCIEPLKKYAFLAKVLPKNCRLHTCAVGEETGEGVLRTPDHNYGLSTLVENEWISSASIVTEQVTVIKKLDDVILQEIPDEPIGFIKIDVENFECKVLSGATRVLKEHRPNLQIEIDPENLKNVQELLESMGYSGLFFFDGRLHGIGQFQPEIHHNPRNAWSPDRADEFDLEKYVVNFFFVPRW